MEILQAVLISYFAGVSIYGFTLLRTQKKEHLKRQEYRRLDMARARCERSAGGRHEDGEILHNGSGQNHSDSGHRDSDIRENGEHGGEQYAQESVSEREHGEHTNENGHRDREEAQAPYYDDIMREDLSKRKVSDAHLLIAAVLGGAPTIYLGMFFMRYKLKNLLFMLVLPTLIGLYAVLIYRYLWGVVFFVPGG